MGRAFSPRRFRQAEQGAISVLFMILFPLLLFAAGIAIDVASLEAEKRYVQAQADLAALTAIRHFDTAEGMRKEARLTIDANGSYPTQPTPDSRIQIGQASRADFIAAADQQEIGKNNAVKVTVMAKAVMYILPLFVGKEDHFIVRSAVASQQPRVSFALSNCLLSLNLLRPVLQPLIGAQVDVLCSGRGIDAHISGQSFLQSLQADASLLTPSGSDLTYGDILNANLPVSSVLGAALGLPVAGGSQTIRLADVIYLAPDLRNIRVGQPLPPLSIKASDIAFATAELLAKRVATVETGVTLPSVGTLQAKVTVGDPRQIVLGAIPGDPAAVARTSQIRVELPAVQILSLFKLTMALEVANASARLTDEGTTCSQDDRTVVAVFDPVTASLLDLDLQVDVLGLPLNLSGLGHVADAVVSRVNSRTSYTREEATNHPVKTFGPTVAVDLAALTATIDAKIGAMLTTASTAISGQTGGSSACTNPLGCLVSATLSTTTTLLNSIIGQLNTAAVNVAQATGAEGLLTQNVVKDLLGLSVAQANLELLNAGCSGAPRLIE